MRGEISTNIALTHLIARSESAAEIDRVLAAAGSPNGAGGARLGELQRLWGQSRQSWDLVKRVLAAAAWEETKSASECGPTNWKAVFDRAAEISPDAACALYLLGREDLAREAVKSIVDHLLAWGALRREMRVLDLGCGAGRLTAALAPHASRVTGVDVSAKMLAVARRRCAGYQHIEFTTSSGKDLSSFEAGSFDLVLACDVFPYLVSSSGELARRHFEEANRVLGNGGYLVILNYSYRGDPAEDDEDIACNSQATGFEVIESGAQPFSHWDGRAFVLKRLAVAAV